MRRDPNEWTNLAQDAVHAATISDLARWLPKVDRPPGSAAHTIVYDAATGEVAWNGMLLGRDEPVPQF